MARPADMSDAPSPDAVWLASLESRALASVADVVGSLLNHQGFLTADARDFNRKAPKQRRFAIAIDAADGSWTSSKAKQVEQRGQGLVALVRLICATGPDRSAEILACVLQRLGIAVDDRPLTAAIEVKDYRELRSVFNRRRRDLGLTFEELDNVSGVAQGYSSKLFGGIRHLGSMSLPSMLGALRLRMYLEPADATEDAA